MEDDAGYDSEYSEEPSREELAIWLSEYMSSAVSAETMYRTHLLDLITDRVYEEFGKDGLCKLMFAIDKKGKWISDIMLEDNDFDDVLFSQYGLYDHDIVKKARETDAIMEMNRKIWRLRRKYSKLIVAEVMDSTKKRV